MTDPDTVSADYALRPCELAATLALPVEARQPVILWRAPGSAKGRSPSKLASMPAASARPRGRARHPVARRRRQNPLGAPIFLPLADDPGRWLINPEELPSVVPMVQAGLYQLILDRMVGEYEFPRALR